jgi:multiple sugar transport system permease protein
MSDLAEPYLRTRRKTSRQWWSSGDALPFILLAPSAAIIAVVIFFPFFQGFYYSLTNGSLIKPGSFVGFSNYLKIVTTRDFLNSLRFSALFAVCNVAGCYLLGLGLALLMNLDVPFRGFLRVALLLPWIVPSVVSIVSWRWMVVDDGALFNQVIHLFGGKTIYFLSSNEWAQALVILIKIWRSFPFMMLSLLAGLQGIDRSLYEAAAIDGAGAWKSFLHITMPQLRNISVILCLLMTIWTVNDFDTPWLLTQGGPSNSTENFVLLANRYTFSRSDVGVGSAISFITLAVLMLFIIGILRQQRDRET